MVIKYKSIKKNRKARVRNKITWTEDRPRLSVFRSNKYISAQVINDSKAVTLTSASTKKGLDNALKMGVEIAKNLDKLKINKVVFDRGSYAYHGMVKSLATGMRDGGIKF